MSQRSQHIHFSQSQSGLPDSLRFGGNCCTQLGEKPALDLDNLFLRVENLGFVFFQLRSGETLRAHQSLFSFIILRDQVQIGF